MDETITPLYQLPVNQWPVERVIDGKYRLFQMRAEAAESDCRKLCKSIEEVRTDDFWKKLADTWEEFCQEFYGYPAQWIEYVAEGYKKLGSPDKPTTAKECLAVVEVAAKADPTLERRQGQRTDLQPRSHDYEVKQERGSDYLAQRIAEAAPEIHQKMLAGEYTSTRAAAIDAGIVKPRQTFSVGATTEPGAFAGQLFERLDQDFLVQVVAILNEALG
ncbi:hypothetical protein Lepto7375DRAFT_0556 [Leptolyngbya sp. PCC 7375]|nr:hypothetical protein Lepto7375DRAFT_0556 [Leptolyngbya sp. PCC 7375]